MVLRQIQHSPSPHAVCMIDVWLYQYSAIKICLFSTVGGTTTMPVAPTETAGGGGGSKFFFFF